jgi:hypothetical protein
MSAKIVADKKPNISALKTKREVEVGFCALATQNEGIFPQLKNTRELKFLSFC